MKLVYALTALHNFIYQYSTEEEQELGLEKEKADTSNEVSEQTEATDISESSQSSRQMDLKRDAMAAEMWAQYIATIS